MILHIDDSAEIRQFIYSFLNRYGYQVIQAEDGPSGLKIINQFKPRLVLLDLDMPGMNGWDVIKHLKGDPKRDQMRVVAFTGSVVPEDRAKFLAAGFDDLLIKPPSLSDLLKIVQVHYSNGLS